jgi:hypothetical protein
MVMGVLLVVCASFTLARPIHAASFFDQIWIGVGQLILGLVGLVGNLLVSAINQLLAVAAYNEFGTAPAVVTGWVIVRDLGNMLFIVFLLIISFGTILRIEQYRYNQLLGRLLLMAVLINFSKVITLFFIDGAQVVMLTFVSAFRDAAVGNLTTAFGLSDSLTFLSNNRSVADVSSVSVLVTVLLALAVYIIAFIVTLVILVVLIIRVFALWILIILSPMAYALRAFPNTRNQSTRWWSEFGKHVTTGPVIAFFLWLALTIMASGSLTQGFDIDTVNTNSVVPGTTVTESPTSVTAALSNISSTPKMLSFMFAIAFLLTGLSVAQGLGGAAGKLAGEWSERIKKGGLKAASVPLLPAVGAAKLAGFGVSRLGRKIQTDLAESGKIGGLKVVPKGVYGGRLPFITKEFWEGFRERGDERRHEAMQKVAGLGKETASVLAQFVGTRDLNKAQRLAGEYEDEAFQANYVAHNSDRRKRLGKSADSQENIVKDAHEAYELGGAEGEDHRRNILATAAAVGHMDDVFNALSWHIQEELEKSGRTKLDTVQTEVWDEDEEKLVMKEAILPSAQNMRRFALAFMHMNPDDYLKETQEEAIAAAQKANYLDKQNLRVLANMTDDTRDVGHTQQFYGLRDEKTHAYYLPTIEKGIEKQRQELAKKSPNDSLLRVVPHIGIAKLVLKDKDKNGYHKVVNSVRTEHLDELQRELMSTQLNAGVQAEARRVPTRNPEQWFLRFAHRDGSLITDDKEAQRKGFRDASDLKQEYEAFMNLSREGLTSLARHYFYGEAKSTRAFPAPPDSGDALHNPVRTVSEHFNYQDLEQQVEAHGYGGMIQAELLALRNTLADPKYAAAFGQVLKSDIQARSIETGKPESEVAQTLQRESEQALRKALSDDKIIPKLSSKGDSEDDVKKAEQAKQALIEALIENGKQLSSQTYADTPPFAIDGMGMSTELPPELLGTPGASEALRSADAMKKMLDPMNVDQFGKRLGEISEDIEKSFRDMSDSFHRSAQKLGNVDLSKPIEDMFTHMENDFAQKQSEGKLQDRESQREYLERLRAFYRSFASTLAHTTAPKGSKESKEAKGSKGK